MGTELVTGVGSLSGNLPLSFQLALAVKVNAYKPSGVSVKGTVHSSSLVLEALVKLTLRSDHIMELRQCIVCGADQRIIAFSHAPVQSPKVDATKYWKLQYHHANSQEEQLRTRIFELERQDRTGCDKPQPIVTANTTAGRKRKPTEVAGKATKRIKTVKLPDILSVDDDFTNELQGGIENPGLYETIYPQSPIDIVI